MRKPIVYLRNDPHDRLDLVEAGARPHGMQVVDVDALVGGGAAVPPLDDVSAVVVGGGAMNADQVDAYPGLAVQRRLLREAVDRDVPVLGICLGAQLLARALDAPVMRAPERQVGFHTIELTTAGRDDPVLSAFRDGDHVFHFHEDTFELPPGAVLLARDDVVEAQAYRIEGARAWAVQFHPEIAAPVIDAWVGEVGEDLEREWGKSVDAVREEAERHLPTHRERARELFTRFAAVASRTP